MSAWLGGINFDGRFFRKPPAFPPPATPVPANLDWDLWLGPCTRPVPYHPVYHPRSWRGFNEFGLGLLGDWSCHTLDAPFWALGLGMPAVVEREHATGGSTGSLGLVGRGSLPGVALAKTGPRRAHFGWA